MLPAAALEKEHNGLTVINLFSQDSDNNQKISKKELEDYIDELSFNNQNVPEFLQKLQEKFDELDKDRDSELTQSEVSALQNNRGMWMIADTPSSSLSNSSVSPAQTSNTAQAVSKTTKNTTENALSELLKDGFEQAAKYAFEQMKDKINVQDIISKVF